MRLVDIERLQNKLKADISLAVKRKRIQHAIDLLDAFADSCQRINNILRDDEVELDLQRLSDACIKPEPIALPLDKKTVVLYDQIGTTICLGLQYLRALVDNGYKVVYLFESPIHPISPVFFDEVKRLCKDYYIFSSRNVFDKNGEYLGNVIRRIILKHRPSNIIVHQEATGALAMTVLYSLNQITRYKIVAGDHHFYLGYDCFDFFLEFRPFGWSTSVYERRLPAEKIINNTYYPIVSEDAVFNGFPFETNNKIIVLSGGASYKFEGSNDFYELLEYILDFDNVVFAFMGSPTGKLEEMKEDERYSNKIHFLGYRSDFSQVIKRIDILYNSFPMSGGLFCQTAAFFNKPILAYSSESLRAENCVEDILGIPENGAPITLTSKKDFKELAKRVIEDPLFRVSKGKEHNKMLITKEYFDNRVARILNKDCEHISKDVQYVDRSERISVNIYNNNVIEPTALLFPSKALGLRFFYHMFFLKKDLIIHFKYIVVHAFSNNLVLRKLFKKSF